MSTIADDIRAAVDGVFATHLVARNSQLGYMLRRLSQHIETLERVEAEMRKSSAAHITDNEFDMSDQLTAWADVLATGEMK